MSYRDLDGELRCKFDIYVRPIRKPLHVSNDIDEIYFRSVRAWRYLKKIDERSSRSILTKKKISEFQTGIEAVINTSWLPVRSHICQTCTSAHHLNLGSSKVARVRSPSGAQNNHSLKTFVIIVSP